MKPILTLLGILIIYGTAIILFSVFSYASEADYLIVLGCGLNRDKETQVMIDRTDRAVTYLKMFPACKVILSGGITSNNTVSEASVMKRILLEKGIDEDRILLEEESKDTPENMMYSGKLLDHRKKIVICSSDYHVLRAVLLGLKYGYFCHHISCRSSLKELLRHIPMEEACIILNQFKN
ncbi:MAG: YdcF family protein [Erysipelotrichaceae bacterium]|nr:YdcF family protein [Erysipelotrichaceae bacterium]MBQ2582643.1 YdcF family protein [Erysipelotrichaceae bacterium]